MAKKDVLQPDQRFKPLTRRYFLKFAGVTGGASILTACQIDKLPGELSAKDTTQTIPVTPTAQPREPTIRVITPDIHFTFKPDKFYPTDEVPPRDNVFLDLKRLHSDSHQDKLFLENAGPNQVEADLYKIIGMQNFIMWLLKKPQECIMPKTVFGFHHQDKTRNMDDPLLTVFHDDDGYGTPSFLINKFDYNTGDFRANAAFISECIAVYDENWVQGTSDVLSKYEDWGLIYAAIVSGYDYDTYEKNVRELNTGNQICPESQYYSAQDKLIEFNKQADSPFQFNGRLFRVVTPDNP